MKSQDEQGEKKKEAVSDQSYYLAGVKT